MNERPMGVIEGFYGNPWSFAEREECVGVLAGNGANTYVWAPKSEPRHRDSWDEPFTPDELSGFASLARCSPSVAVSVGLTPGAAATPGEVIRKVAPALGAGCAGITLCFDDLPELAAAARHRDVTNAVAEATGVPVWIVPTHYAGTSRSGYLTELVDGLHEDVLVMWTGNHVVTDTITADDAAARADATGGRPALLWDNTPVNDAMMSAYLHLGPYHGRADGLREAVAGVLLNPMISMRGSLPTVVSACAWWSGSDPVAAWEETVDELGLRVLAAATAYPGDPHWPGDEPSREWLAAVAALSAPADPSLAPWVEAARSGAGVALAALDVVDALERGDAPSSMVREFMRMSALAGWLRSPARTLGAGPRTRPVFTQDGTGRFAPTHGAVQYTVSVPEHLVRRANEMLRGREGTHGA